MRAIWLCLGMLSVPAHPEDNDKLDQIDKEFITTSVNLLSDCSGFFEFMARTFESDKKPATATEMRDYSRGAQMAAAYLLSLENVVSDGKPKTVGDFTSYADGRAMANINRLHALLEQEDIAGLKAEQKRCLDALPMQNELIQKLRDSMVGR